MALVFGDSFDHYAEGDVLKKWTDFSSTIGAYLIINSVTYPGLAPHTRCLFMKTSTYLTKTLPAAQTTFICGFWFNIGTIGNYQLVKFMDTATATTEHVSVRYNSSGQITFTRNATVLATSTNTLSPDTWYHLEVKATIDNSAGAYEVRIDGSATGWIPAATAKDTQNGGNAEIGSVQLIGGANSNTAHRFQDFYILNTTGAPNDFIGPSRYQVLRPGGVGTTAEWTGNYADNWQNVCDEVANGDSTFNQSSTAGQTDQFAMSNVPAGTVHAIQHVIMAKRDAGGGRTIRPVTRIGGTDYNGTTKTVAASYEFHCEAVSVSPATSAAWDDDELNAAEFGYELVS